MERTVGAVFLDPAGCIRWFTPSVTDLIALTPADVGRKLDELTLSFEANGLLDDIQAVLCRRKPRQADLYTPDGRHCVYDVQPAIADAGGTVLTFTEIAQEGHRELFQRMRQGYVLCEVIRDSNDRVVNYRFLEVNAAFERLVGIPAEQAVGRTVREVLPGIEEWWIDIYDRIVRAGKPAHFEQSSARMGRHYEVYAYPRGRNQFVTLFDDITDWKQWEVRQDFLLKLGDALRPMTDPSEIHETVTRAALDLFGVDLCYYSEIINGDAIVRRDSAREGRPSVAATYPLRSFPLLKAVIEAGRPFTVRDIHTTELLDEEVRQMGIDFGIISFLDVPVIKAGRPVGVLCITQETPRDWTEFEIQLAKEIAERTWTAVARAHAESALRESEERFRTVAQTVPDLLWVADAEGRNEYVSPRYTEFTGLSEAELMGYGWLQIVPPEQAAEVPKVWTAATAAATTFVSEARMRRHDGVYRWFLARAEPILDEHGRAVKWFGAATDIEDLKQTENALRVANENLNQFAYAATHDLREPLRNVRAFSELLVQACGHEGEPRIDQYKSIIAEGVQRMEDLLSHLLDYTRVTSTDHAVVRSTDARAALDAALKNLETVVESCQAEIVSGELPVVGMGDAHLVQLFQNLLSNALKYRNSAAPKVTITAAARNGEWLFSVRDNGIGIPAEYQQKIFGLFKRLHGRAIPGTGIGLALCQKIVERYGGRIWVESEAGQGAEFLFTVPFRGPGS